MLREAVALREQFLGADSAHTLEAHPSACCRYKEIKNKASLARGLVSPPSDAKAI
jgi:hypothetical protein